MNIPNKGIAAVAVLLCCFALTSFAAPEPVDEGARQLLPEEVVQLPEPLSNAANIDPALLLATGNQQVMVKLKSPPVAIMAKEMSQNELMSHKAMVEGEQSAFMQRTATSSKEIACVQTVLNAVFLDIDASEVVTIAEDPDVESLILVSNYEMHLDETVPYIGATIVQNEGYDGTGIKVAVLDSGIDYTHAAFGGEGTVEAYNASIKDPTSRDGLFPTDKVVEGIDFVGEIWPMGPLMVDDDPIDAFGHGTSVADIACGKDGVAPGCDLYAVKVCSAVASSCNGVAIIQALEYVLDPNQDGDMSDAMDVVNMSLGSSYGTPFDDEASQAVNAISDLGVLVVGSAGNSGDKPYIISTAAAARSSLAVANTQTPSASLQVLNVENENYPAVFFTWSVPPEAAITGEVQYGDGEGGNLIGCEPFESDSLTGKVVLVDRGECNFSLKVSHVTQGGGLACVVGMVNEDPPFAGGDGGDRPVGVPGYMISLADADAIKATLPGGIATIDPNDVLPLVMTMVASSSRGPQNDSRNLIKPEIGAPGSSTAASVGTGTGTAGFSGTSGAAPMVSGAAALVLQRSPDLEPHEVKSLLMNTAETNINTDFFSGLAPITRIGGGEVRVDRAFTSRAAAWDEDTKQGALSFGFIDVYRTTHTLFKRIRIRNYSDEAITYKIIPTFRYEEDEASGAVSVAPVFPGQVRVGPYGDRTISIAMTIIGDRLPNNFMNSGSHGGDGSVLTMNEYDGYLILDDGVQPIHLAWHVLPRKASNLAIVSNQLDFDGSNQTTIDMLNSGMGIAQIDSFSLLALSPNIPEGEIGAENLTPDIRAVGVSTLEVGPGVCGDEASFIWKFAITTWERQQHLFSVRHSVYLDIDQDDEFDYVILNSDFTGISLSGSFDGRQLSYSFDFQNMTSDASFFAEHSTNTGNTMLAVCAEQVGLSLADLRSTNVDVAVEVRSIFFGAGDGVEGITVTPGTERYVAPPGDLGSGESGPLTVTDRGAFEGNSPELGLMLISNADRGEGNRGGATQETELIVLRA